MPQPIVAVIMHRDSDWGVMEHSCATLDQFGVAYATEVAPQDAEALGIQVIIATSPLAGEAAARTVLPVLAVPMDGLESLQASVQLPVATLAIGKAGAVNAALLAVAILATSDPSLAAKLKKYRADLAEMVLNANLG